MHDDLEAAIGHLGIDGGLPALEQAARRAEHQVQDARRFLGDELPKDLPVDVLVFGSVGRQEVADTSDFDHLAISHGLLPDAHTHKQLRELLKDLPRQLGVGEPGNTGVFGGIATAQDLVELIGLEGDTNTNHTHRVLTVLESTSIYQPELRERLLERILDRYLADYVDIKPGVPRFLLNDVLRYWRTMAVDYQAKKWRTLDQGWGLRYLKLIISRKLLIAGSCASLFLCREATVGYLVEQFNKPPLARLAQLSRELTTEPAQQALRTCLVTADRFVERLRDENFRNAAEQAGSREELRTSPELREAHQEARQLQEALEIIFFDTRLRSQSRKYLSF